MQEAAFQKALNALRATYLAALPEKKTEIQKVMCDLQQQYDQTQLKKLEGLVHKLSGSGAMYGMDALGAQARETEALIMQMQENNLIEDLHKEQLNAAITVLTSMMDDACQRST